MSFVPWASQLKKATLPSVLALGALQRMMKSVQPQDWFYKLFNRLLKNYSDSTDDSLSFELYTKSKRKPRSFSVAC